MKMKKSKTQIYLLLIFTVALLIGVGYAALSATLKINGQTTINKASWDVHMEDINVTTGSVTATTVPTLDEAKTTVNFSVKLTNPGDFYEFMVDEVNAGTIDVMVSTISKTGLTTAQAKYLDYTVTYSDGTALAEKQLLKSNQSETLKVRIDFKKDITAADLPTVDTTLNLNFSISYQQADDSAVAIVHPTCKRATVLHNDGTSTYGNLGTQGTLTSGDAFDCDVNGDGIYDSETERFYYIIGDDTSNYVNLIYYNNVSNGASNNTATYAWVSKEDYLAAGGTETDYGTNGNNNKGPLTAIKQLPTTTQWKNVKLSSTSRNITDAKGNITVSNFSYKWYAARLLTTQELSKTCNVTVDNFVSIDSGICGFLFENTLTLDDSMNGGLWLETPLDSGGTSAYFITDQHSISYYYSVSFLRGVRPVIEVAKSKISY